MMLRITLFLSAIMLMTSQASMAQPTDTDEITMQTPTELFGDAGMPSVSNVAEMKIQVTSLMDEYNCEAALSLLPIYAAQANALASVVRAGLEPFYSASSEARRGYTNVKHLAEHERLANRLIVDRNQAWVWEAHCLVEKGDVEQGAARYRHALRHISLKDTALWRKARQGLYELVGIHE